MFIYRYVFIGNVTIVCSFARILRNAIVGPDAGYAIKRVKIELEQLNLPTSTNYN